MLITLGNRKGGCGKSTSAIFLACALAREGRTLLIDADPQGSILSWSEEATDFPAVVVSWPVRDLAKRIRDVADDYAHVVVDTGRAPGSDDPILRQALAVTDQLIVPLSPSLMDVRELGRLMAMVADLEPVHAIATTILLTKVRAGTNSAKQVREGLTDEGMTLFSAQIGLRESYAASWGTTPTDLAEYGYVAEELMKAKV